MHTPRWYRAPLLAILPALTLTACEGTERRVGLDGTADDAPPLPVQVDTLFRVGSLDGGSWDTFARITSVAFGPDGTLYLLDAPQHRIHRVTPEGTYAGSFGRQGGGPGEFQTPLGITVFPSGELAVLDLGNNGFQVRSADGTWLRDFPVDPMQGIPTSAIQAQGRAGVISVGSGLMMRFGADEGPSAPPSTTPIRRWNLDDGSSVTLVDAWRQAPTAAPSGSASFSMGAGPASGSRSIQLGGLLPMAFTPSVHVAVFPDGRLAVADTSSYRIRIFPEEGQTAGAEPEEILRSIAPQPVGPAEQEAERSRRLTELDLGRGATVQVRVDGSGGGGVNAEAIQAQILEALRSQMEELQFWHEIPVITGLRTDTDGRLWVSRSGGVGLPGPVDVWGTDGTLLGTLPAGELRTPDAFGPDGLAAWIERDDLDVSFVRVGRIRLP